MEVDPFQENRFVVEQQVASLDLDAAEADLACQEISARGNRRRVELGSGLGGEVRVAQRLQGQGQAKPPPDQAGRARWGFAGGC